MLDLHSHMLPGLDDGAGDLEQSIEMARMALEDGIKGVVCTPHWSPTYPGNTRRKVMKAVRLLREELSRLNLPLTIYAGTELRLDTALVHTILSGELLTLNDTGRFALIELPEVVLPEGLDDIFWELQVKGITPIISHPERNYALLSQPGRLYDLVNRGAVTQLTGASLLGHFGRKVREFAVLLLEHGLGHILATDAHGFNARTPRLSNAYHAVTELMGEERAWQMTYETPWRIIVGKDLTLPEPIQPKTTSSGLSRFFFWKRRN